MIEITIDLKPFDELLALLSGMEGRLYDELERAANDVAADVSGEAKHVMQEEIYDVPIPARDWRAVGKDELKRIRGAAKAAGITTLRKQARAARKAGDLGNERVLQHKLDSAYKALAPKLRVGHIHLKYLVTGQKVPTTTTKGHAGRWHRTGNLKRSENFRVERTRDNVLIRLYNNAEYAVHRHNLGLSGHRRSGTQSGNSPTRSVQWQERAVAQKAVFIRNRFRRAVENAFGRG